MRREAREDIEKLLYKMSANPSVLDAYHTWMLRRDPGVAVVEKVPEKYEDVCFGAMSSVDVTKCRGFSGSTQYFHDFTLDTSAWPSPDLRTLDVHLWPVPYYRLDVESMLPTNWRSMEDEKRKKGIVGAGGGGGGGGGGGACFNCGSYSHNIGGCPKPKDQERIRKAMSEWRRSRMEEDVEMRYHEAAGAATEQQQGLSSSSFSSAPPTPGPTTSSTPGPTMTPGRVKPRPGVISERLRQALGIEPGGMPPWYRNIVYYGYPPSYYRVPPKPVKFTWIGSEEEEARVSRQQQQQQQQQQHQQPQQPEPRRRVRTVAFPNLAAPLHDLSYFFDLYHPVEEQEGDETTTTTMQPPQTKYNVTTTIDGRPPPSSPFVTPHPHIQQEGASSSAHVVDLTEGEQEEEHPLATPQNRKKRPHLESSRRTPHSNQQQHPSYMLGQYGFDYSNGSGGDVDYDETAFEEPLPTGPKPKQHKLKEEEEEEVHHTEQDVMSTGSSEEQQISASERADQLLQQLVAMRVLSRTGDAYTQHEEDIEEGDNRDGMEDQEQEEGQVPPELVTARLPVGNGVITHTLTEQDLSTHGPVQTSTGVWHKLKSIIEDRRSKAITPVKPEHQPAP